MFLSFLQNYENPRRPHSVQNYYLCLLFIDEMHGTKRIFLAAKIDSDLVKQELIPQLKDLLKLEQIRWANPNQMHLTLRFFGDTPVSRIPYIEEAISTSLSSFSSFDITLSQLKMFGSKYKPQVLWVGIENNDVLKKMFSELNEQLAKIGIQSTRQNFVPHLSLGRIKSIDDHKNFQDVLVKFSDYQAESININSFKLYESVLNPTGAVHFELITFLLKNPY